jgi:hypothetical protein
LRLALICLMLPILSLARGRKLGTLFNDEGKSFLSFNFSLSLPYTRLMRIAQVINYEQCEYLESEEDA